MEKSTKVLKTPLRVAVVALLCGFIMRMMEIPHTAGVIFVSFLSIGILYSVRFAKKPVKRPVAYIKMILVLFWTTNGLLRILDFPYTMLFQMGTALTFILWFAMEGTAYFMDEDRREKNTIIEIGWNFAMVMGVLSIIGGGLMHLMEWDYATTLLTVGLTIVTAYILKDIFKTSKEEQKGNNSGELQL